MAPSVRSLFIRPLTPGEGAPVQRVAAYKGWTLLSWEEWDGDGFCAPEYEAVRGDNCVHLPVSRFCFHPNQDRFDWLIDNFINGEAYPPLGVWSDSDIDELIAAERAELEAA